MLRPLALALLALALFVAPADAQKKALFDNSHAETAGNADWIIDDTQPVPSPAQSGIGPATPENYWTGGISAFGVALVKRGYTVHTLTSAFGITYGNASNTYDLSKYDLFVIPEPNTRFTPAESLAIFQYVQNGGGLILIVDHWNSDRNNDGYDSPEIANLLDAQKLWGVHSAVSPEANNYFTMTSTNVNTSPTDSIIHGPEGTATGIAFHGGTSFTLHPANNPTVTGDVWVTGQPQGSTTGAMVAHSVYGNGRVVYVGDSSPVDDGSATAGNSSIYDGWGELAGTQADSLIFLNAAAWAVRRSLPAGDTTPPTVALNAPANGVTWKAGSTQAITWTASDNVAVTAVDLAYSTDGGASWPNTIATGLANSGSYSWTLPNFASSTVRVRVTARDAAGNSTSAANTANFTVDRWIVTAAAGSGGTISPSGAVGVAHGANQSFTVTPNANQVVSNVVVDAASVGAVTSYTFTNVTAHHSITASFSPVTWTITASAGTGGSISPEGLVPVTHGGSQGFVIEALANWHVADVLVDGGSVGAATAFQFTGVTSNHTIAASFAPDSFTVTLATSGAGTAARLPDQTGYTYGATLNLLATPASGWAFSGWTGDTVAATNPLPLRVLRSRSLVANFADVTAPSVALVSPAGGETWDMGTPVTITWTATDNAGVDSVDVDFSPTGPAGPWYGVAHGLANDGSHSWTVQPPSTTTGYVRVTARDAAGNAASDTLHTPVTVRDPSTDDVADGPLALALTRPVPNPSSGATRLAFALAADGFARIEILDPAGRRVAQHAGVFAAGRHAWTWDGRHADGSRARAGLYFARLTAPGGVRLQRLVRLD